MSMIPLVLPLKANEAAALADLVYQQLEGKPLTADVRNRFAGRLPQLVSNRSTCREKPTSHSTAKRKSRKR